VAATGVKIAAPELSGIIAGMPLRGATPETLEKVKEDIQKEVSEVLIETDKEGLVIKADTLGSLEALTKLLKDKGFHIRRASVGPISKKDLMEAESNYEKNHLEAAVLGFNIGVNPDAVSRNVKIITSKIIYQLIDDFEAWQKEVEQTGDVRELETVVRPCKIELLSGYVFRQSNPAILGVETVMGTARTNVMLMKDGEPLTRIRGIQKDKESVSELEKGEQAALSLDGVTIGRQIKEGDILYSFINEDEFKKLKSLKKHLTPDELACLKEIAQIMRDRNPVWGV
jgi:translation initiation factor 5B